MKKLVVLSVSLGLAGSAGAQLFTPESFTGAAFGAITGAIIGGRHAGTGAAIGAGAGWLLGTMVHESRVERGYYDPHYYPYYPGYGYAAYYYPAPQGYYTGVAAGAQGAAPAVSETTQVAPPQTFATGSGARVGSASAMSSANALFGR